MTKHTPLRHAACGKPLRSVYVDEVGRVAAWTLHAGKWRVRVTKGKDVDVYVHTTCQEKLSAAEAKAFRAQANRDV